VDNNIRMKLPFFVKLGRLNQSYYYHIICILLLSLESITLFAQTINYPDSIKLYSRVGKYSIAADFSNKYLELLKTSSGDLSRIYLETKVEHADIQNRTGKAFLNIQALPAIIEDVKLHLGENDIEVGNANNHLGIAFWIAVSYGQAIEFIQIGLNIRRKNLGENDVLTAKSYNNLGAVYKDMGNLPKAASFFQKSLDIKLKLYPKNHLELAGSYNNLGIVYRQLRHHSNAKYYFQKALDIRRQNFGELHPEVGQSYGSLGGLSWNMGQLDEAENYFVKAIEITAKTLGEGHPYAALFHRNLAVIWSERGAFSKAENEYMKALEIQQAVFGSNHIEVSNTYYNLSNLYFDFGKLSKAQQMADKSLKIRYETLGKEHPLVGETYFIQGKIFWSLNNLPEAKQKFLNVKENLFFLITNYFPYFSDAEKETFFEGLHEKLNYIKCFLATNTTKYPDLAEELFDIQIVTKAILLNSSAKWKHRIKNSGDKKLFKMFDEWETYQNKLVRMYQTTENDKLIDSIRIKAENLEKELSIRSESFVKLSEKKVINWKDIQKELSTDEVALEIIRYSNVRQQEPKGDSASQEKGVKIMKPDPESVHYLGLIVSKKAATPKLVLLKNGYDLENRFLSKYRACIQYKLPDETSYIQYWEPLKMALNGANRVFLSSDGVYNQINLNTLKSPTSNKFVLDEANIHLLTTTKDITLTKPEILENKLVYLFGDPKFWVVAETANSEQLSMDVSRQIDSRYFKSLKINQRITPLPGTKHEIEQIGKLFSQAGWELVAYEGPDATESNLKNCFRPRVLHLATHGYFVNSDDSTSKPMLRSGILLTGSENTLKGNYLNNEEDGILSASEGMNLNLDQTEIVVLSACETGLGEVVNGEGVYGLQRALHVAGARNVIMSLWNVNDQATSDLMVQFYTLWLDGTNKRDAFKKAQMKLREKYPEPYYWGAFVIMGE